MRQRLDESKIKNWIKNYARFGTIGFLFVRFGTVYSFLPRFRDLI